MTRQAGLLRSSVAEVAIFAFLGPLFACLWLAIGNHFGLWGLPNKSPMSLLKFIHALMGMYLPFGLLFGSSLAASAGLLFAVLRRVIWGERYPTYALCALLGSGAGMFYVGGMGIWAIKHGGDGIFIALMPAFAGSLCALVARILWHDRSQAQDG